MNLKLSQSLLEKHRRNNQTRNPEKIIFTGFDDYDIYNPSAAFTYQNKKMIVARVEKRDSEISRAIFFYEKNGTYHQDQRQPIYDLQDPFMTQIQGHYIFGGTSVKFLEDGSAKWYTKLFIGKTLETLEPWVDGPKNMKDVRVVGLNDGRIGIFSRPQGKKGGRGKIGFTTVQSFDEVTAKVIEDAPLIDMFSDDEWGGANDAYALKDGRIKVLGHIAFFDNKGNRHYYAMRFILNPSDLSYTDLELIAERKDFLEGPTKRDDLKDVIFTGGLSEENHKTYLYVGTSDCEVQRVEIK